MPEADHFVILATILRLPTGQRLRHVDGFLHHSRGQDSIHPQLARLSVTYKVRQIQYPANKLTLPGMVNSTWTNLSIV